MLTTSMLNLANSSTENLNMIYENIYIDDLLLEVKKEVENRVSERLIKIQYINMPLDSMSLIIKGNLRLLYIAFFNIMENACKFSDNKEVMVILECTDRNIKSIRPVNHLVNVISPAIYYLLFPFVFSLLLYEIIIFT
jgi:signal transduction histidine kinase